MNLGESIKKPIHPFPTLVSYIVSVNLSTIEPAHAIQATHYNHIISFLTFSACVTVRGNPSSIKPFLHSGFLILVSIISTIKLSSTNYTVRQITAAPKILYKHITFPAFIMFCTFFPNSDPDAAIALNMSPKNHMLLHM